MIELLRLMLESLLLMVLFLALTTIHVISCWLLHRWDLAYLQFVKLLRQIVILIRIVLSRNFWLRSLSDRHFMAGSNDPLTHVINRTNTEFGSYTRRARQNLWGRQVT